MVLAEILIKKNSSGGGELLSSEHECDTGSQSEGSSDQSEARLRSGDKL